jgi:hypothetical protein
VGIVGRRARRRVLVAGAVTGAAAYHAGKKHEQRNQDQYYDEPYDTGQPTQYAPAPPQYAPVPPQSSGPDSSDLNQIAKLAELHQSGALTDEEFAVAKAKLLA